MPAILPVRMRTIRERCFWLSSNKGYLMKSLVIVESPAKAKTIAKYLGKDYTVKASVGHIMDLPKSKLGVDIENNFEPKYIQIKGKAPVVKELKSAAKKADRILLATDPDREGEAIAFHVAGVVSAAA